MLVRLSAASVCRALAGIRAVGVCLFAVLGAAKHRAWFDESTLWRTATGGKQLSQLTG